MPRIFICYRREDASGHAGRLRDALAARFGSHEIFRDIETIGPGEDFVLAVSRAIGSCKVFLSVIGRDWVGARRRDGTRRLDDPDDHVRREITEALGRNVCVIPLLVEHADMPRPDELPDELRGLARRNAIILDDHEWDSDVERLAVAVRRELGAEVESAAAELPRATEIRPGPTARPAVVVRSRLGYWLVAMALALLATSTWLAWMGREAARQAERAPGDEAGLAEPSFPKDAAPPGSAVTVRLPAGSEAELGEAVYEVLDAQVVPHAGGATLSLRIRATNNGRYDLALTDAGFRLRVGGASLAPSGALLALVPARMVKDASLTFALPPGAPAAALRITQGRETGDIPLDLAGGQGLTPERHRAARSAGNAEFPVAIDPAKAEARFGSASFVLRAAQVRRYAHKLTLTLAVSADNRSPYPTNFADSRFRLLLDGHPRAPVGGLNELVDGRASKEGDVVFDLPLDTRDVVIRVLNGDAAVDVPLRLPAVR